jgi:hypothetical protein
MPIYFLVLEADFFHGQVTPALAASWRQRSFAPCRSLCQSLKPAAREYAERFHTGGDEPMLMRLEQGLPFDRAIWRMLAGEVLLYGACDVPEIMTVPDTLGCLLARAQHLQGGVPRSAFPPIYQAHYGTRDLVFGGAYYRPDAAGLNDVGDVARLADYLETIDPGQWSAANLSDLPGLDSDEEREEELELARDWFPPIRRLYAGNRGENRVIVCEVMGEPMSP